MLDLDALLSEVSESPPCGPNLEHDLTFFALEQAARGKPAQEFGTAEERQFGTSGEDPRWSEVADLSHALLRRSKDLRVAVYLTRALTRTRGVPGLEAGLAVIAGLLERYWDDVHPLLDADDGNDATERLNALAPLADAQALIKDLRDVLLIDSRQHGQLRVRDIEIAMGRLGPAAGAMKPLDQIHAQLASAFASDRTMPSALRAARSLALSLHSLLADRAGVSGVDLKPLVQCIETALDACDSALGTAPVSAVAGSDGRETAISDAPVTTLRPPVAGEIRSREDAVRVLDLVCAYLERAEPSNPAPLLIRRAQRLMAMTFVDIVKDLMPDSLSQLQRLAGDLETT
jgi:type VI secretion system protein ImpA